MTIRGLKRALKEPLLQFGLGGIAIFIIHLLAANDEREDIDSHTIFIDETEIERIERSWRVRQTIPPTSDQLLKEVESYVNQEILYREALRLGLDKNDQIVKRRMIQKMQYLFNTGSPSTRPSENELIAFYERNESKYMRPERISFRHLFFDPKNNGQAAQSRAEKMLAELDERSWEDLSHDLPGDPFFFGNLFSNESQQDIDAVFGDGFYERIAALEEKRWSGPEESVFGLHLIYVENKQSQLIPDISAVRDQVSRDLRSERQEIYDDPAYVALRDRYSVVVSGTD